MVKLCCDRCGKEIEALYYTISFWPYYTNPKYNEYDCATACASSYTRESALQVLNSQKMYCCECKEEIEKFMMEKNV